ncbi:MAG: hypothetical protein Alpg2KO_22280 [Alphaproteobacteria bacterium]
MLHLLPYLFWLISASIIGVTGLTGADAELLAYTGSALVIVSTGALIAFGQVSLASLLASLAAWMALSQPVPDLPDGGLMLLLAGFGIWAALSVLLALIDAGHRPWQRVCLLLSGVALVSAGLSAWIHGADLWVVTLATLALALPLSEPSGNALRMTGWLPLSLVSIVWIVSAGDMPPVIWVFLAGLFGMGWLLAHPPEFRTNLTLKDWLVTGLWGFWSRQVVYRDVTYKGLQNVPKDGPVLLLGNHYNGLVDGTLILSKLDRPLWMMAKATLKNLPVVSIFFRLHNMIFVHRREDAQPGDTAARAGRNSAAIDACVDNLCNGSALLMFPEGRSHDDPEMKPFRKGAARIAMAYAERAEVEGLPPLTIIPVGLSFEDKTRFGSRAIVSFGKPIAPPAKDANAAEVTEQIRAAISAEIVESSSLPELEQIRKASNAVLPPAFSPAPLGWPERTNGWLSARKRLSQVTDRSEAAALAEQLEERRLLPGELFLDLNRLRAARFVLRELEFALVGLPMTILGFVAHIPLIILLAVATQVLDRADDQFSTNIAVPGFIFQPIWYVILSALLLWWLPTLWAIALMVLVPIAGWHMLGHVPRLRRALTRARHYLWLRRNPKDAAQLRLSVRKVSVMANGGAGD